AEMSPFRSDVERCEQNKMCREQEILKFKDSGKKQSGKTVSVCANCCRLFYNFTPFAAIVPCKNRQTPPRAKAVFRLPIERCHPFRPGIVSPAPHFPKVGCCRWHRPYIRQV